MPAREAARLPAALPAGPQSRLFWILVLCADLLLLLLLPQMVWVGAALLGLLALAALAARAEWTLALLFLGGPLFQPLGLAGSDALALQIGLRGLFVVAWLLALGRDRGAGRAGEVFASSGALARPVSGGAAFASALRDPQTLILVALTLLLWAGLARTPAPTYGDEKLKSWLVTNCTLFLAPLLLWPLWRRRRHLDGFLQGAVALGALFAGVGVLALLGLVGSGLEGPPLGRLAWLGTSPIWVGRLQAIWIVLLCWAASRRLLAWPIACGLALLALWLLLRTGSRGPLLALFACPAALLLLPARSGGPRPGAIVLRITLALGLAGALLLLVLPEPVRERTAAVLLRGPAGLLSGAGSEAWLRDPASVFRTEVIARGLAVLREVLPWGGGTGSFPALLFLRDFRLYPHNIEIELLVEQGWPGLALFVALLWISWRRARALARRDAAAAWLFALLAMAWWNAQVSGDLPANGEVWFWAGMIAGLHRAAKGGGIESRPA